MAEITLKKMKRKNATIPRKVVRAIVEKTFARLEQAASDTSAADSSKGTVKRKAS